MTFFIITPLDGAKLIGVINFVHDKTQFDKLFEEYSKLVFNFKKYLY